MRQSPRTIFLRAEATNGKTMNRSIVPGRKSPENGAAISLQYMALQVATLACERLDRTSALVVQLRKEADENADDQGVLSRIFSALSGPSTPGRAAEHE